MRTVTQAQSSLFSTRGLASMGMTNGEIQPKPDEAVLENGPLLWPMRSNLHENFATSYGATFRVGPKGYWIRSIRKIGVEPSAVPSHAGRLDILLAVDSRAIRRWPMG